MFPHTLTLHETLFAADITVTLWRLLVRSPFLGEKCKLPWIAVNLLQ